MLLVLFVVGGVIGKSDVNVVVADVYVCVLVVIL